MIRTLPSHILLWSLDCVRESECWLLTRALLICFLRLCSLWVQGNILDFADKFVDMTTQGLNAVAKGMKNLMAQGQTLAVTRAVQGLLEGKSADEPADTFLYFDPKLPRGTSPASAKPAYRDVMVCMIGGGNYLEYHSLKEMSERVQPKCNVVYGATEMLAPCEFLQQLNELGNKGK